MARKKSYAEKLKDPKWQRARLKILERDKFSCRACFSQEKTLHVHHMYYKRNLEPWEYPPESLVTLCEDCHEDYEDQVHRLLHIISRPSMLTMCRRMLTVDWHPETVHGMSGELYGLREHMASFMESCVQLQLLSEGNPSPPDDKTILYEAIQPEDEESTLASLKGSILGMTGCMHAFLAKAESHYDNPPVQ